jgi:hypothetical protein
VHAIRLALQVPDFEWWRLVMNQDFFFAKFAELFFFIIGK